MDRIDAQRIAGALEALNISAERIGDAIHRLADEREPDRYTGPYADLESPHEELTFGALAGTYDWAAQARDRGETVRRRAWLPGAVWRPGEDLVMCDLDAAAGDWEIVEEPLIDAKTDLGESSVSHIAQLWAPTIEETLRTRFAPIRDRLVLLYHIEKGYRVDVLSWTDDWREAVPVSQQYADLVLKQSPHWAIADLNGWLSRRVAPPTTSTRIEASSASGVCSTGSPLDFRWFFPESERVEKWRLAPEEKPFLIAHQRGYFLRIGDGTTTDWREAHPYVPGQHPEEGARSAAKADLEGWVENTGECVFGEHLRVEVEFRNGERVSPITANIWRWSLIDAPYDIVRYRLA